jgi:aspartate aminotransferase-like enzyme
MTNPQNPAPETKSRGPTLAETDASNAEAGAAAISAILDGPPASETNDRELNDEELYQLACDLHEDSVNGDLTHTSPPTPNVDVLRSARTFVSACRAEAKGRNQSRYDYCDELLRQLDEALGITRFPQSATLSNIGRTVVDVTPLDEAMGIDWTEAAKLAGKHGIRYPTNAALQAFLFELRGASE